MSDDAEEFAALVRQIRLALKDYFRERSAENLSRAKELERQVDDALDGTDQPGLFDREEER